MAIWWRPKSRRLLSRASDGRFKAIVGTAMPPTVLEPEAKVVPNDARPRLREIARVERPSALTATKGRRSATQEETSLQSTPATTRAAPSPKCTAASQR